MCRVLMALVFCLVAVSSVAAQDHRSIDVHVPPAEAIQRLRMSDGSQLYGRVEAVDDDSVDFRTIAGVLIIVDNAQLVELRLVEGRVINGEFRFKDPHTSRLMIGPTARSLRRGEGYVTFHQFAVPSIQVGLTDRVSIGTVTPLMMFGEYYPILVTPKIQLLGREKVQVAAGTIHLLNVDDSGPTGLVYGVTTLGSADNAMTLALGYAFSGNERRPLLMLGGELRETGRVKWFTESWLFGPRDGFVSGGARILRERFSTELALAVPLYGGGYLVPMINFTRSF